MNKKTTRSAGYILGHDAAERQRLEMQAARLEPATRQALEAVGVASGWNCLDVACGTGAVMRMLGPIVGSSGSVHGIDLDDANGSGAVASLNAAGPAVFSFQKLDVTSEGDPQGAPFDLVFTRLLICHMVDPAGVVARLWRWVKPGGVLLIQDYDMGIMHAMPESIAHAQAFDLIRNSFTASGKDARAGASMPHYFLKAGAGFPDGTLISGFISPMSAAMPAIVAVLTSLTPALEKLGLATPARVAEVIEGVRKAAENNEASSRGPDLIASWKRKPA
jgi:ubiquinone/menaquinone biosynthesis C-methylase UbiE